MAQNTITVVPSGYSSSNSSYSSISSSYPITNAYSNSSSTNYAYVTCRTGSSASTYLSLTFDLSEIPDDAVIDSVTCKAKGRVSSTSYISTAVLQLYNGSTAKGSSTSFRTTSATVYTLNAGSWSRSEIDNIQLRYTATRGTSNTTRAAYIYVYGADLSVTYTWNDIRYTVTTSISGGTLLSDQVIDASEGEMIDISFVCDEGKQLSSMKVNGTSVTPDRIEGAAIDGGVCLFHLDQSKTDDLGNASLSTSASFDTSTRKFGSSSIRMDGSSYIEIALPQSYTTATVECWFYVTKQNTSGEYPTLFSTTSYSDSGGTYMHIDDGSYSQYPVCRCNSSSSSNNTGGYGTTIISRNEWHHFCYCRNNGSHYYFIDGVLQYTVSQSSPNDNSKLYFGGLRGASSMVSGCYMTGYIDEILVTSACKHTSSFTPPTSQYSAQPTISYIYSVVVNSDLDVVIIISGSSQFMIKQDGTWVSVGTVYKKINGAWVVQTDLAGLFDTSLNYCKG